MRTLLILLTGFALGVGVAASSALGGATSGRTITLRVGDVVVSSTWTCAAIRQKGEQKLVCGVKHKPPADYVIMAPRNLTVYRCLAASCSIPDILLDEKP